jgi:hypothetical protein
MTSYPENYESETLRQGIKFNKYQQKITKTSEKKIKEGFSSNVEGGYANSDSKQLISRITNVQNAAKELNDLQSQFGSTLERYKTAQAQLLSTTKSFLADNLKADENSLIGKNIYVNKVSNNLLSDFLGAYMDNAKNPPMDKLSGQYSYDECQLAAVNNGKQFFSLSNSDSVTQKASCSTTNDLSLAEKYGAAGANCNQGTDGYLYGGESTNAIYQVPDAQFVGNFGDTPNRAMPTFANGGSRTYTYETCKKAAIDGGFSLFGLQWYSGGENGYAQCALSNDFSQASKYGQSGNKSINGQDQTVGGGWANAIYQVQSNNKFIGCYKDVINAPSMTPVGNGVATYSVESCQQAAINSGSKYFALQGGLNGKAKCFVSNSLSEATRYGESKPVSVFSDGKNYGNGTINSIYKVKSTGYPEDLGKLGYIDNNAILHEYPKQMILSGKNNDSPTIINSDSSCSKEIVNVDSNIWQKQKKSANMMTSVTKCGLSESIQADQRSAEELRLQLQEMSSRILSLIQYLTSLDESVIKQMGVNKSALNDMVSKYTSYNSQFSQYKNVDINNYNNILEDSKLVASQNNYNYILWSGITVIVLLLTLQLVKRSTS